MSGVVDLLEFIDLFKKVKNGEVQGLGGGFFSFFSKKKKEVKKK
jgi:hypothetical protein